MKKRRHWPKFCDVVALAALIDDLAFGGIACQTGMFLGHIVRVFVIEDQKHNHCCMANFGLVDQDGAKQHRKEEDSGNTVTWRLTEFFTWCRRGRNDNDQNNQHRCQDGILAIERAWNTRSCEAKQLVHHVAVSVANSHAVWTNHLDCAKCGTVAFRKTLAKELLLWCVEQRGDEDMKQNVLTLFTGAAASGTADALVPGAPVAATSGGATATHVSPARPRERRKKEAVSAGGDEHETVNVPAGHFNILDAKDCA